MPEFMIVGKIEGEPFAQFADDYSEARNKMMDIECGLGGYSMLYIRREVGNKVFEYQFLEA